jgi:Ca2+-binding RTX toxin-like protein
MPQPLLTTPPLPSRVTGHLHSREDVDCYRLELRAGQRYFFDLQAASPIELSLLDARGETIQAGVVHLENNGQLWAASMSFVAPVSGPYFLGVASPGPWRSAEPRASDYVLAVGSTAADDRPDLPAGATPIVVGNAPSLVEGRFDLALDTDLYALDLAAGQRAQLAISARELGSAFSTEVEVRIVHPGTGEVRLLERATDGTRFLISADVSGRWLLDLRYADGRHIPNDGTGATYRITTQLLGADDHADLQAAATPLSIGTAVSGQIDLSGDRDWFRVDLVAGKRYQFGVTSDTFWFKEGMTLTLLDADGHLIRQTDVAQGLAFDAPSSGRFFVRAEVGDNLYTWFEPQPYQLLAQEVPADDHRDGTPGATPLQVGASAALRFDVGSDIDVFRFEAVAGQRYAATLVRTDGEYGVAEATFIEPDGAVPTAAGATRYRADMPPDAWIFTASGTGPAHLALLPKVHEPSARWRVELRAVAPDDHADAAAAGTTLALGAEATGSLSSATDQDWFKVALHAGERYRVELIAADARFNTNWYSGYSPELELLSPGAGAPLLTVIGQHDGAAYSGLITAPMDGLYTLRPQLTAAYAVRVSVAGVEAGDEADEPPGEALLDASPAFKESGLLMVGTDGNDTLSGGARSDIITSGNGDDRLWGGLGDDTLDGGAGRDELHGQEGRDTLRGGPDQDEMFGGAGDDVLAGDDSDDRLHGDDGNDQLLGGAGNDRLDGGYGNDYIEGGDGIDTVQYRSNLDLISLSRTATGWQLVDNDRHQGTDTLNSVERIDFTSTRLALDLDGHAGSVAKVIGALLGKQQLADRALVGLGLSLLDGGLSYADLVAAAVNSDLFWAQAGTRSTAAFVDVVYRNVTGHAPGADEAAYFRGLVDSGTLSLVQLAVLACDSAANAASIDLAGLQTTGLAFTPYG